MHLNITADMLDYLVFILQIRLLAIRPEPQGPVEVAPCAVEVAPICPLQFNEMRTDNILIVLWERCLVKQRDDGAVSHLRKARPDFSRKGAAIPHLYRVTGIRKSIATFGIQVTLR